MATAPRTEDRVRRMTPVTAPADQKAAVEAVRGLLARVEQKAAEAHQQPKCELIGPSGQRLPIPEAVFHVLERVVEVLARGDAVTVVPVGKELTTQQAAHLLNVSRQYLVRLLDEGRIPFTRTGSHRRLRIEDVLAFKEKRDAERHTALDELTSISEELGGYDELR